MKKNHVLFIGLAFIIILGILTIYSINTVIPDNPLEGTEQIVLVVSKTETSSNAMLYTFSRDSDKWRFHFSCPVVIGKNGMAWGIGLHNDKVRMDDEPVKMEGDSKSPKGAFELLQAFGYLPPTMVRIKFPYTQVTSDMICIDDVRSEYYNMVVKTAEKGLDTEVLPSHEDMLRNDNQYKYTVFVGHNAISPVKDEGSCIFLHVWKDPGSYTAGCTAMSEENILKLLGWLDPDKYPCLVQLSRKSYHRLKEEWGLPEVKI
ncbi:MAG TPA: hypothetical protein ENH82_12830 [bacterium]|nr:hypothetical protein [bacterium]